VTSIFKKVAVIFILGCLSLNANSQETGILNHLSAGLKAGSDGLGLELAAPIGQRFQVSLGYSMMPPLAYRRTFNVPEHPGASEGEKGADIPTDAEAAAHLSDLEVFVSYFPIENNNFHISAGLTLGPHDIVRIRNLSPMPPDYNIIGLDVDGYTVKAVDNNINGYIDVNQLKPYIGIGYGRAFNKDKRVCLSIDFGALYWGKPGLFAPGEPLIGDWEDVRISSASLGGRDEGLIEFFEKIALYPLLNATVYIRLF